MKAKYIGKYVDKFGKYTDLEYEYRNHTYFVRNHYNGNACGESLYLQHQAEQNRIDEMIESENQPIQPYTGMTIDEIFEMLEWD